MNKRFFILFAALSLSILGSAFLTNVEASNSRGGRGRGRNQQFREKNDQANLAKDEISSTVVPNAALEGQKLLVLDDSTKANVGTPAKKSIDKSKTESQKDSPTLVQTANPSSIPPQSYSPPKLVHHSAAIYNKLSTPKQYIPDPAPTASLFSRFGRKDLTSVPFKKLAENFDVRSLAAWSFINVRTAGMAEVLVIFQHKGLPFAPPSDLKYSTKTVSFNDLYRKELEAFWDSIAYDFVPIIGLRAFRIYQHVSMDDPEKIVGSVKFLFDSHIHNAVVAKFIREHCSRIDIPLAPEHHQFTNDLKLIAALESQPVDSAAKWKVVTKDPEILRIFDTKNSTQFDHIIWNYIAFDHNNLDFDAAIRRIECIIVTLVSGVIGVPPSDSLVRIFKFGSFRFGGFVYGSDFDLLCLVPEPIDTRLLIESLRQPLETLEKAYDVVTVPDFSMISFKLGSLEFDLLFTNYIGIGLPEPFNINLMNNDKFFKRGTEMRGVNGFRNTEALLARIPQDSLQKFSSILKIVKVWAKKRGIYHNSMGFLGGMAVATLSANIILSNLEVDSLDELLILFFKTYANWDWENKPIDLTGEMHAKISDQYLMKIYNFVGEASCITYPVTVSTLRVMREEFNRAFKIISLLQDSNFSAKEVLDLLFLDSDFFLRFPKYLQMTFSHLDFNYLYTAKSFIEPKLRSLIGDLEEMQMFVAPYNGSIVNPFIPQDGYNAGMHSFSFYIGFESSKAKIDQKLEMFIQNFMSKVYLLGTYQIVDSIRLPHHVFNTINPSARVPLRVQALHELALNSPIP